MWIEKGVTGSFQNHFEVPCGLEQTIDDHVMTKFEVHLGLEQIVK
jgi:hypothetical protein